MKYEVLSMRRYTILQKDYWNFLIVIERKLGEMCGNGS